VAVQYVTNSAVKPGRYGDVARFASACKEAFLRYGGTGRLFSMVPSGDQTGRVLGITEFSSNEQLGAWLDAGMGGDEEITRLAMSMLAEDSPFYDTITYITQEIPIR
jgi:hypothetical protein